MIRVLNFRESAQPGAVVVNATSRSGDEGRGLSPFLISGGRMWDGTVALNMENAWQFTKVYKCHVGDDGDPTEEYFGWARDGWRSSYAHRYPMGKGAVPLYSYWGGHKLDYLDAKERLYVPMYAKSVLKTDAWQWLVGRRDEADRMGVDLVIRDFDAYDHRAEDIGWRDVIRYRRKFGHGFVLAFLLEGLLENGRMRGTLF